MVALQVVTVGQAASERFERLQNAGDYTEAYFTHGLGVQTAEATADYLHHHIRRELGLTPSRASAIPGATRLSLSWTIIAKFSNCCPPNKSWA